MKILIIFLLMFSIELDAAVEPDCKLFKTTVNFNRHYDCGAFYRVCYKDMCREQEKL